MFPEGGHIRPQGLCVGSKVSHLWASRSAKEDGQGRRFWVLVEQFRSVFAEKRATLPWRRFRAG